MNHGTNNIKEKELYDRLSEDIGQVLLSKMDKVEEMTLWQIELILSLQGNIENIDGDLRIRGQKKRGKKLNISKIQEQFNNLTEEILC